MVEPWRRASPHAQGPGILRSRSLATGHRRLAELLRPGLRVLDVGCGPGTITRGIAEAVGPSGQVVGVDLHPRLIAEARRLNEAVPSLTFTACDAYNLPFRDEFDIVTAARVLQWLSRPLDALHRIVEATKFGGRVVVLDYNHEKIIWTPDPPDTTLTFHAAFLRWRTAAGLDNAIADHLMEMFAAAGLRDIVQTLQSEVARRADPDFPTRMATWAEIPAFHGPRMVEDGVITEAERAAAETDYRVWMSSRAESQALYLIAVDGIRPV
ncbi:MAG TPA: methyltransferase domain-containing protein [bacterium]|nr:methyltransferase domain-containing protein [bacterium]